MLKDVPHDPEVVRRPLIIDVIPLCFLPIGIGFILKGERLMLRKKIDSLNYECESAVTPQTRQGVLTAFTVVVNPTWENNLVDVFQIEEWSVNQNYPLIDPKTYYLPSLN